MRVSWPASVRGAIADLDLNYYLPCTARGRVTAWLGVSRTETGEFLSSDDVELLQTLTNYVGIAIENANLYHSLRQKVEEYERLRQELPTLGYDVVLLPKVTPSARAEFVLSSLENPDHGADLCALDL